MELQNTEDNTLPLLRKQLADTNRGIENILNAIQQGILTSSTKERLEELEKLREKLKTSILQRGKPCGNRTFILHQSIVI